MKYRIAFYLFCCLSRFVHAQPPLNDYWLERQPNAWLQYEDLTPVDTVVCIFRQNGQSGLMDISGKVLLPANYSYIWFLQESPFLWVRQGGKYGVAGRDGKLIVPIQYDRVVWKNGVICAYDASGCSGFAADGQVLNHKFPKGASPEFVEQDGFQVVSTKGAFYGLVDSTGAWAIQPRYPGLRPVEKGYWIAGSGKQLRLIYPRSRWESKQVFDQIGFVTDRGFWAKKSGPAARFEFYDFRENRVSGTPAYGSMQRADSYYIFDADGKKGLLDKQNKVVLEGYEYLCPFTMFSERGLDPASGKQTKQWFLAGNPQKLGLFDGTVWLTPAKFRYVLFRYNQVICFMQDSVAILDTAGRLLHTLYLPEASNDADCWLLNRNQPDSVWHMENGWLRLPPEGRDVAAQLGYLYFTDRQNRHALFDETGKLLIAGCDEMPQDVFPFAQRIPAFVYRQQGLYGWLLTDRSHTEPARYDKVVPMRRGGFLVQQKLRWGIVNCRGETLVPVDCDDAKPDNTGNYCLLKKNGRWQAYFPDGKRVVPLEFQDAGTEVEGALWGKGSGGWQAYSLDGKALLPATVDKPLAKNYGGYTLKYKGKYGQVGFAGDLLYPFEWDTLVLNNQIQWGKKGDSLFVFKTSIVTTGDAVQPMNGIGYAVQKAGLWHFIYPNGQAIAVETCENWQELGQGSGAILVHYKQKNWALLDYSGKTLRRIEADAVFPYIESFISVKNDRERYLLNIETGARRPQIYDRLEHQPEGYYEAFKNGKYGATDLQLREIIPCRYDRIKAFGFWDKFIQVYSGDQTGLFDLQGNVCIPLDKYQSKTISSLGQDLFTIPKYGLLGIYSKSAQKWIPASMEDIKGCQLRIPLSKQLYWFRVNGKYGIIDEDCKEVLPPVYTKIEDGERYFVLSLPGEKQLYDPKSRQILAGEMEEITFYADHALCKKGPVYSVFLDGVLAFSKTCEQMYWVNASLLHFEDPETGKEGLLRTDGSTFLEPVYDYLEYAGHGAIYARENGGLGILDLNGKPVLPFSYDAFDYVSDRYAKPRQGKLYGLIEFPGREVLPVRFTKITIPRDGAHFICEQNGSWQFYDRNGQLLVPGEWEEARAFRFGLAAVKKGGNWGYINLNGETVIPFQYRYAGDFAEYQQKRTALVIQEKTYATIDATGSVVADEVLYPHDWIDVFVSFEHAPAYQEIPFKSVSPAHSGCILVITLQDKKQGLINLLGEWVVRPDYDEISFLDNQGNALARIRQGNGWGLLGKRGEILAVPQFDALTPEKTPDYYKAVKNGETFFVNERGERIK